MVLATFPLQGYTQELGFQGAEQKPLSLFGVVRFQVKAYHTVSGPDEDSAMQISKKGISRVRSPWLHFSPLFS